jgi:hypothetical protein
VYPARWCDVRTYGRVPQSDGTYQWSVVQTDANGNNDLVWFVTLCQTLLLNLNESPFFATYGIPQQQSVEQQVPPDYYVSKTQQAYAQYFTALNISKVSSNPPTYKVVVVTHSGVAIAGYVNMVPI